MDSMPGAETDVHGFNEDGMLLCSPEDRAAADKAHADRTGTEAFEDVTCPRCRELISRPPDTATSWEIAQKVHSRLRKGDRLWDIDPQAARELTAKLVNVSNDNDEEARTLMDLYGAIGGGSAVGNSVLLAGFRSVVALLRATCGSDLEQT